MHGIIHAIVGLAASQLVALLSLDMGLSLQWGDLRREVRKPVFGRTLAVALVGVPLLAILVATTFPLSPAGGGVVVLMAVSPGAPMVMNKARKSGNLALAVTLAVTLTLAALVLVPVEMMVLNRMFPVRLQASVPALVDRLLPQLLVPLALGFAVRTLWPAGASALEPFVRRLFQLALLVAVIAALAMSWREIARMSPWGWLAMLLVTFGAVLLGDAFGGPDGRDRATAAYAVVLGNPAIAMTVVALSYPTLHAVPVIVAYAVLRALLVLPYEVLSSRRLGNPDRPTESL
jgi:bile acid:Na+ symporter, BASS family